IGPLAINGGGRVLLGAGTLIPLGDVTATSLTSTASPTISGASGSAVDLFNSSTTFTVNDGPAADDLTIAVPTVGTSGRALVKEGAGQLAFTAANTYLGSTAVNAGVLRITDQSGLGGAGGDGTTVAASASLDVGIKAAFPNSFTINERLFLNGSGAGNA